MNNIRHMCSPFMYEIFCSFYIENYILDGMVCRLYKVA